MSKRPLTSFESWVIEQKGTERPFTGQYVYTQVPGTYHCKKCEAPLYSSEHKFISECGWPSFDDEIPGAVQRQTDRDGHRVEILCAACGAHLGHVFEGELLTPKNVRHCVNSVSMSFRPKLHATIEELVLASGCFWGTEYFLRRIPGVVSTTVGYCGGELEHPTYKQVCTGKTGHVEAVLVRYDPTLVDTKEILRIFFETHDFTQVDGQGPDLGPQYLSVIFYDKESVKNIAESLLDELIAMGHKPATRLQPAAPFWAAEDYHQQYYESKGETPYCHRYRTLFQR